MMTWTHGLMLVLLTMVCTGCSRSSVANSVATRSTATLRLSARDAGLVLMHGDGPGKCDELGARDVWVYQSGATYYMHYDGAGPPGWLTCLATSSDGIHWAKQGPVLSLGAAGEADSASASYGVTYQEGNRWHLFYLGTPNVTPAPERIPGLPYLTMKAQSSSPTGPWTKQKEVVPFRPTSKTYYSLTASPGQVIQQGEQYLMFFSASTRQPKTTNILRTLGIARTNNLDGSWIVDAAPIVPSHEQIENASLYYEASNQTWFLFTNHVGLADNVEFTDAIWVYWSKDLNQWDALHKAIVLDGTNCKTGQRCIGLPSVIQVGNRLAVYYDTPGGVSINHMHRDVGLAWLDLPLVAPQATP